ncbi:MmgE/PrpD family protein [compost metagenome]
MVRGQVGPLEVTGEAIHAPDILAVSRRIEIVENDELSARFPGEILSIVSVTLKDGQTFASPVTAARGDPATAMSQAEFRAKFDLLAGISLDEASRRAIEEAVAALPDSPDCERLFALLFSGDRGQR